jgi:hypothetical protein
MPLKDYFDHSGEKISGYNQEKVWHQQLKGYPSGPGIRYDGGSKD